MMKMLRSILLVIITIAFTTSSLGACSLKIKPKESSKSVSVENGMIDLNGTTINFGKNSVPDGDSASMQTTKATNTETENGLCSELYELTLTEAYGELVTVTIPVSKDYTRTY